MKLSDTTQCRFFQKHLLASARELNETQCCSLFCVYSCDGTTGFNWVIETQTRVGFIVIYCVYQVRILCDFNTKRRLGFYIKIYLITFKKSYII